MRIEFLLLSALLVSASADADDTLAPSEDERAVLLATRGEANRKPSTALPVGDLTPPTELDGAELQAWFDQRFRADPSRRAHDLDLAAPEVADEEAEADLLRRIERGRRP